MPEKKPDPKMPQDKDAPKPAPKPEPMENPEQPQEPEPDDNQIPKNYTPRGDAVPMDPRLASESQQPFESGEAYRQRVGTPEPRPGVYDESITRGDDPKP